MKKLDGKKSAVKFPSLLDEERKKKEMNEIKEEAMEEEKDGGKKKPKAEMVDAWTQTERSDYSIIKSRMLNHQQYANTLIKQPENTLKLKAQKNMQQQFARTPTQQQYQIAHPGGSSVTQQMQNLIGSSTSGPSNHQRNRYPNTMGQT